jgi:hypothetical protein
MKLYSLIALWLLAQMPNIVAWPPIQPPPGGTPTPAFVQDAHNSIGSTTLIVTFGSTIGTGHIVAGNVTYDSAGSITSVLTGAIASSCTVVDTVTDTPDAEKTSDFYCPNVAASQNTIHIVVTGGTFMAAYCDEYSGVATSTPLDVHTAQLQTSVGTGTNGITSGSVTTTTNGDLVYGATFNTATTATASAGTAFTVRGNNAITGVVGYTEDLNLATAGSTAATLTAATSGGSWDTFVMAFKP